VTVTVAKFSWVSTLVTESYQQMDDFANTKVGNIMDVSGRNKCITISYKAPISDLIDLLSKPGISFH
jgi:hypothetical protein